MPAIELRQVTKTYPGGQAPAVRSLSLAVQPGSLVTLLGPSGSGKTTVLRLVAGFERAEAGEVLLAGRLVSGDGTWVPPEKRGVGMVFQDYALFPHLTVTHNIGFGYRGPDRQARIEEMLALVDLTSYEARYPHELSGGEQQRVALARALARRPVVVLLDEPFSNLDAALRAHMRLELRRILRAANATAILVSHDHADALGISDRIVVLNDGSVEQTGSPREIFGSPANWFVATFMGQRNLLKGVVGADGRSVQTGLGTLPCPGAHAFQADDPVYACIRPDRLQVTDNGEIHGTITGLTYGGSTLDAIVDVGATPGVEQLHLQLPPDADVRAGQRVGLHVAPASVTLVPDGDR